MNSACASAEFMFTLYFHTLSENWRVPKLSVKAFLSFGAGNAILKGKNLAPVLYHGTNRLVQIFWSPRKQDHCRAALRGESPNVPVILA